MHILNKPRWQISENEATPEEVFFNRRQFIHSSAAIAASTTLASVLAPSAAWAAAETDGTMDLYPAKKNPAYTITRPITPVGVSSIYNNFYEFGSHKRISGAAQALPIRPWDVVIDGEVENPMRIGIEDLIRKMPLEERLYRHRCVEAWAMTVPWTGFPMTALLALAAPKSSAAFLEMETFHKPSVARGQKQSWYPWPYKEGLTLSEAKNELSFLVTGVYGKPLLKQYGAPLRLAVPWKYGFKSIKSIVRFHFTKKRPVSFWEKIQPREYGFWANVNPQVPHPRWSQATEELLGEKRRVPTKLFNGYGEFVADIYDKEDSLGLPLWR